MVNAGGRDNKRPLELLKHFSQKFSNGSCFSIDSSCQPWLVQGIISLVAWNGSMLLFWSRSGKRTRSLFVFPFGGRDSLLLFWLALLYSLSLLGQNFSKSKSLLSLLFGQKNSKSNFNSTKIFTDNSKFCLTPKTISILQKYSMTISNCVSAKFQSHLIENILRQFQFMSLSVFSLLACLFHTLAIGV